MSLKLDNNWDICADANGNLAVTDNRYGILQDVATACRMWLGENIFDTDQGIPFDGGGLLDTTNVTRTAVLLEETAATVPGVKRATCYPMNPVNGRSVFGIIAVQLVNRKEVGYVRL